MRQDDGSPASRTNRPRVVVVGAGKMGLLHGGLLTATGEADVVGIVDLSSAARRIVRAMGVGVATYATLDGALAAEPDVTACFVCTPPSSHHVVATAALAHGLDVFVEKPLTVSAERSHALARDARERVRVGRVGYVRRHHPVYQALRAALGATAPIRSIKARIRSPQFANAKAEEGMHRGGLEWDLMPHVLDMALWLSGTTEDVRMVAADFSSHERVSATARAGGVDISLLADWADHDVRKVELDVDITLADGSRLGCDEDIAWKLDSAGERKTLFHRRDAPAPWFDVAGVEFSQQTKDLIRAFRGEPSTSATLEEAARVDAFIEQAIRQSRSI